MSRATKKTAVLAAASCAGALLLGGTVAAATTPATPSHPPPGTSHHGFTHHRPALVNGPVSNAGPASFTVTKTGGTTVVVDVNSSTTYSQSGTKTAPSGVSNGERVTVIPTKGTSSTATTVTASHVSVDLAQVNGTVGTVGSSSFTVSTLGGLTTTVDTGGSTAFTKDGASVSGVTSGEQVAAYGTPDATDPSQLDALFVDVHTPPTKAGPLGGWWPGGLAWFTGPVSDAGPASFTVTKTGGTTVVVDVNSATTYSQSGTKTAPSGVSNGERVTVIPTKGTSSTATTVTASHVSVDLAQVNGTVGTVGSSSFTVSTLGGLTTTVDTGGSTAFTKDGASVSGVTSGEQVAAYGTPDATDPSQLDALFVDVHTPPTKAGPLGGWWPGGFVPGGSAGFPGGGPKASPRGGAGPSGAGASHIPFGFVIGKVSSVVGDDITVAPASGSPRTVVVSASTKYFGTGASSGLSAVTTGVTITAAGTTAGSGDLDAVIVFLGTFPMTHHGAPPSTPSGSPNHSAPAPPWPGSSGPSGPGWGGHGGGTSYPGSKPSAPTNTSNGPEGGQSGAPAPGGWH